MTDTQKTSQRPKQVDLNPTLDRPTKTADPKKIGRVTFKNNRPEAVTIKTANNFFVNPKLKNEPPIPETAPVEKAIAHQDSANSGNTKDASLLLQL